MKNKTKELLKELLLNNFTELRDVACEINCFNGSLEYLEVFENDEEFFEIFFKDNILEAVRSVCYGDYNYNDDYVKFNAYGNLESFNEYEFEEFLRENINEIVEAVIECKDDISFSDEINEILCG